MKKRKILYWAMAAIVCCMCCVPSFATSYNEGIYPQTTYFAAIPYSNATFYVGSNGGRPSFSGAAGGSQFTVSSGSDASRDPAWAAEENAWIAFDSDAVPDVLEFTFEQQRYSNPSAFYSAYNLYDFSGGQYITGATLQAVSFGLELSRYPSLASYAKLQLPAGVVVDYAITVSYYGIDADELVYVPLTGTVSGTISTTAAGAYSIYPLVSQLFDLNYFYFDDIVPVESFTLALRFSAPVQSVGFGMIYGRQISFASAMVDSIDSLVDLNTPEPEIQTVYVSIWEEGGDLFTWLLDAIDGFFSTPFIGSFSFGDIGAFVIGLSIFMLLLSIL